MPVAVGIDLTNECNLACPHCYRPTMTQQRLSVPQVQTILDNLDVGSVNLGVGENGVHPEYRRMLALFRAAPIPAGEHIVEIRYESWTPRAGTLVSFLTTLALTGLVGVRLAKRD